MRLVIRELLQRILASHIIVLFLGHSVIKENIFSKEFIDFFTLGLELFLSLLSKKNLKRKRPS
jgi:hypothetical protein